MTAALLVAFLESVGMFGATTYSRALELSRQCATPTAWAEQVADDGWIAVCGDEEGRPVSYRGSL